MVRNKIHLPRSLARAAVVMIMAGMIASTGVAAAEPNNGPVVGETFQIWPRNPQQASGNCWQAAQDHNTAINKPDYDGIVDALNRVEQYNCDVVPI
jgi:hypothetical protein